MSLLLARRRPLLFPSAVTADGYAGEILADSPSAYWRFEETSGSTVADEVDSLTGTVFGANLDVSGTSETGSAASFDGTDDRISFPDSLASSFEGSAWSFSFIMRTSSTNDAVPFSAGSSTNDNALFMVRLNRSATDTFNTAGAILARYRDNSGNDSIARADPETSIASGDNRHVAVVLDVGTLRLYLDGAEAATAAVAASPTFNRMTAGCLLRSSAALFFNGVVDEVAVFPATLSASRIAAQHAASGAL